MGKKGKNKNQTINTENVPKVESENIVKEEKQESAAEKPVAAKVEELKEEPEKVDLMEGNESKEGTLKSKKRRNRKKKSTATEICIEERNQEKVENANQKEEPQTVNQAKSESTGEKPSVESSTDTLKGKRRRNRKKTVNNVGDAQEENLVGISKNENAVDVSSEKSGEETTTSQQNTLKKRKRNRNKNKNAVTETQNEPIVETVEKPLEPEATQMFEAKCGQKDKPEPQRRGKKQKRFDLTSKKTILDELQERQEREQKEARDHIKNEIAKREKLLETIDLVLDCHKSEVELAKNQQESLKDVKILTAEAAKPRPQPTSSKTPKQSSSKKSTPVEEELVNKIEQVLGMTKLEIQNAQTQQAYVSRLEAEVAKVKQSKDILLGGQPGTAVPPHIQKMAHEMRDLSKGEVPKTKEELIKEIESRDVLMSEINRVLDNTKSEIDKVQKQQKIIQNLEVELNKMKEQEIVEKLMALAEDEEPQEPLKPPPPKQSPATASLLDALMANVGKLKEIQAMKEKQKAEQEATPGISEKSTDQKNTEVTQEPIKLHDAEHKIESNAENTAVAQKQEGEKSKSPPKDAKKIVNEKKQPSPEGSPTEQKKHQKDQKKQPQKMQVAKPKAEEMKGAESKNDKTFAKIDSLAENIVKKNASAEAKQNEENKKESLKEDEKKQQLLKEDKIEILEPQKNLVTSENKAPGKEKVCKPKPDDIKLEPAQHTKPESPKKEQRKRDHHNKDKGKHEKDVKNLEVMNATKNDSVQEKKVEAPNKENSESNKGEEILISEQKKLESPEDKKKNQEHEKHLNDAKQKEGTSTQIEVKPTVASSDPVTQESGKDKKDNDSNKKVNDQKKNDKGQNVSPKGSHKNKNHKHEKKDALRGFPEVIPPAPIIAQKPSMAEMLKNAPDPPPEEVNRKPNEEIKVEAAPLARPESVIIEVNPSEQIKELIQPVMKEDKEEKIIEEASTANGATKLESELKNDDEIVIVDKVEVEAQIKEDKVNEQDLTDPKNVQRGGLALLADAKPLKKDGKQQASKSPIKSTPRPSSKKELDVKSAQNKSVTPQPKLETQARINSKLTEAKKTPSPAKPSSPTAEKPQPKFESANVSNNISSSQKIDIQNATHEVSSPSTDKPKIPPRPDVTKTSNTKPVPRAGNVTNQSSSPIKPKTPSPTSKPSVAKPATISTAQSQLQSQAARPKPTVSQTRQSATSKTPISTKTTNPKPLATQQKINSTKTATPKSSPSTASATDSK